MVLMYFIAIEQKDILESAFNIDNIEEGKFLKGIVSRKLQILPKLMNDME